MTAQTLALVLIRVLAIKFIIETLAEITAQLPMLQMTYSAFEQDDTSFGSMMLWMVGLLVVSKVVLSIILIIYSRKLANRIVGQNTETLEAHPELAPALTHVGILLIGLSLLVYQLPQFLGTAIQWFQAHASEPESMAARQNGAMAEATVLIIIAVFLILRGKSLTRALFRLSK